MVSLEAVEIKSRTVKKYLHKGIKLQLHYQPFYKLRSCIIGKSGAAPTEVTGRHPYPALPCPPPPTSSSSSLPLFLAPARGFGARLRGPRERASATPAEKLEESGRAFVRGRRRRRKGGGDGRAPPARSLARLQRGPSMGRPAASSSSTAFRKTDAVDFEV